MRCNCPHCSHLVRQDRNVEGINYCTHCRRLFLVPPEAEVPRWIFGVLAVLTANWHAMCRF